jgi:hypothetical protein
MVIFYFKKILVKIPDKIIIYFIVLFTLLDDLKREWKLDNNNMKLNMNNK